MKKLQSILLAGSFALLCSCNPGTTVATAGGSVRAKEDRVTLRTEGQPNAYIDADGSFFIDGKPVEVTPEQRVLLLSYKHGFNAMTAAGIAVGKQGAAMAGKAVTAAIKGAMGGDSESIDKTMEAEGELIRQEALKLCQRLVVIHGVQERLAADLPAFKPYATIDMADVEDCEGSAEDAVDDAVQQARTTRPDAI